jgi:hypothetical protein
VRVRGVRSAVASVATAVLLATGCGAGDDKPDQWVSPDPTRTSVPPGREGVAGIPPQPDQATARKYADALDKIDRDVVNGDVEQAVDRGRALCVTVQRAPEDEDALVKETVATFTSQRHPKGFGTAKSKRILTAVRKYLCPDY